MNNESTTHSSPFIEELESGKHQSMLSFFNAVATGENKSDKIDSFLSQLKSENKDLRTIDDDLYAATLRRVTKNDNFPELINKTKNEHATHNAPISYQDEALPEIIKTTIEKFKLNFPLKVDSIGNPSDQPPSYAFVNLNTDDNNKLYCELKIEKAALKKSATVLEGLALHEMIHLEKDHVLAKVLLNQDSTFFNATLNWAQEYQADTAMIYKNQKNTRALSCHLHELKSEMDAYFFKSLAITGILVLAWLGVSYQASTLPQETQNIFTDIAKHGYLVPSYLLLKTVYKKDKSDTHPPTSDRIKNVKLVGKLVKTAEIKKHSSNLD
jgi:hypothetical protein